jgi:hypothetical protein
MDACDKVSGLVQCGKDNSPELISGLMSNIENSISVTNLSDDYIIFTNIMFFRRRFQ